MLREFGFSNYYGFREGITVSFELGANCPKTISNGLSVSTIMCVKGANAAGKTTVLRALSFVGEFATKSFSAKPNAAIPIASYFRSEDPTEFFVDFEVGGVRYIYEAAMTDRTVVSEEIFRKVKKKTSLLRREGDRIVSNIADWSLLKVMKLRSNVSVIATARQYDFSELDGVFNFFSSINGNVAFSGLLYEKASLSDVAKELYADPDRRDFVEGFLKEVDAGITQFVVYEFKEPDPVDPEKDKKTYVPFFVHGAPENAITWHTESSGTRALVHKLSKIKQAIRSGGVLLADELDLHLHPKIVPKLLQLFTCSQSNPHCAQLVFTTHQSDVLDIAGKYRTLIVSKRDNESFGYRLDEVAGDLVRNDRPVAPIYDAGKIGGVPRV
ncbi:AAA family ATPase [Xanthomonas melonis]|uniref:ATPase AAA-type core domain-containing protein n=1 Tax=Xanthomonas melonis TaxID=56456 RepID=A0A2S7DJY4_9XANT|nr:ATP-binding protein [Xanthomonas melonis]MCC4599766.1 AAA family ATPase [Xanthomonas melonis]PPU74107.1 hypothetical protein XmelCFBP4644_06645 [Xanthomonas melonis]